jgi:hypothetical protein
MYKRCNANEIVSVIHMKFWQTLCKVITKQMSITFKYSPSFSVYLIQQFAESIKINANGWLSSHPCTVSLTSSLPDNFQPATISLVQILQLRHIRWWIFLNTHTRTAVRSLHNAHDSHSFNFFAYFPLSPSLSLSLIQLSQLICP